LEIFIEAFFQMTIAEQLRQLLAARDPHTVEGAVEIAKNYAGQCRVINQRLARCSDYLRRGLRSEAVHLAECHPNVIRAAEDLQPPEASELERLYSTLGLAAGEEPNPVVLEDLRIACQTEQSLASLLSQHRMLAVGRGPIQHRLAVLNALARMDPDNPTWQNDFRQLEPERVKGIEREYKTALRESDLPALEILGREIAQTPWIKPLPPELVSRIQKSAQTVRRQDRIKILQDLVSGLEAAREADDQTRCAELLDEWQRLTTSVEVRELELPVDLMADGSEVVQSTGTWLTTERRRRLDVQRNGERRSRNPGQMETEGDRARPRWKRGISTLLSRFRFLVPRSLRGYARMDHTV
jgi:hypothetical protein